LQVSFILPILNEKVFIFDTIESILDQKNNRDISFEILISDGGSTDGTLEIVAKIIQKHSNVFLVKNSQKIVSSGFNKALNKARGKIIIRVDGHCKIPKNYLEKCCKLLEERDAAITGGVIETVSSGLLGNAISIAQSTIFGVGGVKFRNKNNNIDGSYVDTLAFGAHKRSIFIEVGGYDEELVCNQDDEFNYRVLQSGKKIWMDPSIKTQYYARQSFFKLSKQYFNYGFYKVRGIQKRGSVFSIRHLIPVTFIFLLNATIISGIYFQSTLLTLSIVSLYMILNIFASILASPNFKLTHLIFLSYVILHFSYGLGFLWGMIRFLNKWQDTKLKDCTFNRDQFLHNSLN